LVLTFLVLPFWYLLTRVVPDIFQKSSKTVVYIRVSHHGKTAEPIEMPFGGGAWYVWLHLANTIDLLCVSVVDDGEDGERVATVSSHEGAARERSTTAAQA